MSRAQCTLCAFFGFFIYCGPGAVERLNSMFMVGAAIAFCLVVHATTVEQPSGNLDQADWGQLGDAVPVIVVALSFHNIVPSVFHSLGSSTVRPSCYT